MSNALRTEVRRDDDDELLGFVEPGPDGAYRVLSVFGGVVTTVADAGSAEDELRSRGLSVLAETWWYDGEPAVLLEASPGRVVARVGGITALALAVGSADDADGHRLVTLTGDDARRLTLTRP